MRRARRSSPLFSWRFGINAPCVIMLPALCLLHRTTGGAVGPRESHMHVTATLDIEAVALEAQDEVSVLLQLAAPTVSPAHRRPPAALVAVLDRSGSMSGERLAGARRALSDLGDRLGPRDSFGLGVFRKAAGGVLPVPPCGEQGSG